MDASKLSALADRGDRAFCDPIAITRDRLIIDGYARWELAKRTGRRTLECFEYDLSAEDALEELIRAHRPAGGLTDFVRIELALDLEPYFREKAFRNQQSGGKDKGTSKLTIADRVDTRREVARVAGVSCGNVRKVKQILMHACSILLQAVRTEEVSINRAEQWSYEPEKEQRERLRLFRIERGIKRKARTLVAAIARAASSARRQQPMKLSDLIELVNRLASNNEEQTIDSTIEFELVDIPGRIVFVTEELARSLRSVQEILVQ